MRAAESNAISIGLAPHAHRPLESGPRAAPLTNAGLGSGQVEVSLVVGASLNWEFLFSIWAGFHGQLRMRAAVAFAVFTGCYRVAAQACAEKNVMQT